MRALDITFVTETYPPEVNGVAMTVGRLVGGLSERGHRVSVVRPRQNKADHRRTLPTSGLPVQGFSCPPQKPAYFQSSSFSPWPFMCSALFCRNRWNSGSLR